MQNKEINLLWLLKPNAQENKVWLLREIEMWKMFNEELSIEDIEDFEKDVKEHLLVINSLEIILNELRHAYLRQWNISAEFQIEFERFYSQNKIHENLKWYKDQLEKALLLLAEFSEKILFPYPLENA